MKISYVVLAKSLSEGILEGIYGSHVQDLLLPSECRADPPISEI